jgi:hypothetical protein
MVHCIIIDGWHKGHMIDMPELRMIISLIRPPVVTIDDCCDGSEVANVPTGKVDYQLAFRSIDGDVALYSTNGKSSQIYEFRDWIMPVDSNWREQPLHVGIHDPRAVMEAGS